MTDKPIAKRGGYQPVAEGSPPTKPPPAPGELPPVPHKHSWQPVGIVENETILYSPVSVLDHQVVIQKMAVTSCNCGAIRRVEVERKTRWLNR